MIRPGVYLVGAGPGDEGLFTLRGREILAAADVVIYDYLVNPAILAHARCDSERLYVGKKAGAHSATQEEINALLVEKGARGGVVCRLKGGDPFVFGRGGEELLVLLEAGIRFEVVPGITAAIAAPAYAGIPVTHRAIATSLALITGHEDPTKEVTQVDWARMAQSADTLCLYMGVRNLPEISAGLQSGGRPAETPVAVIQWGTHRRQRVVTGTLADIAARVAEAKLNPPAMIVIGEVVRFRERMNWFERGRLWGQRVLVTRTESQATLLADALADEGADVRVVPAIAIIPLPVDAEVAAATDRLRAGDYAWVIFTSVNAVRTFVAELKARNLDARIFAGSRLAAIGPATAEELAAFGLRTDITPERFVAESLLEVLPEEEVRAKRILCPRALKARPLLVEELRKRGAVVDEISLYDTVTPPENREVLARELAGGMDWITFTASSTVEGFVELGGPAVLATIEKRPRLAAIGPITAQTMRSVGLEPDVVAEEHTIKGIVEAMAGV